MSERSEGEITKIAMATRDPIHGWIKYSDAERKLIDTPLMQRLRRVKQLTTVDLVYPGGNGSRFEHSLGAMHIAGMYCDVVLKDVLESVRQVLTNITRAAALMHDIGHGPFSHSFDRAVYSSIYTHDPKLSKSDGHDVHRHYIIHNDPAIRDALEEMSVDPDWISAVWNAKSENKLWMNCLHGSPKLVDLNQYLLVLSAIVQGPMGADRMDFTMRDSYYTGMTHLGTIAHTRIMDHAKMFFDDGTQSWCLSYSEKVLEDMLHALDGRQYMYRNVYLHKTCIAGSILIEQIMQNISKLIDLKDRVMDLEKFVFLNDSIIMEPLMMTDDNDLTRETIALTKRYLKRNLPKLEFEQTLSEHEADPEVINTFKGDPDFAIDVTRIINSIDPKMFDKYSIYFYNRICDKISCTDALKNIGYSVPQKPYRIVRVYRMVAAPYV